MGKIGRQKTKENHELMKLLTSANGNYKSRKAEQKRKYDEDKKKNHGISKNKFKVIAGIPA